ncbi:DNA translocase FtsK 4TM domain-containing protein, partial [Candidatus Sumerlaeota bacterium]|nr:DNA translocase FtsK 4TM domain-containing protein [Candidatus Sumerlaeota bacterium]
MNTSAFQLSDDKVLGVSRNHQRYLLGGFSFLTGLFFLLSVAFSRQDQALFGTFGAAVKHYFTLMFGNVLAYLFPLLLIYWGVRVIQKREITRIYIKLACVGLATVSLCSLLSLPFYNSYDNDQMRRTGLNLGGMVGNFITSDSGLRIPNHIGLVGSVILFSAILIPSLLISTDLLFYHIFKAMGVWLWNLPLKRKKARELPVIQRSTTASTPAKEKKSLRDALFKRKDPNRILNAPDLVEEIKDKSSGKIRVGENEMIDPLENIIPNKKKSDSPALSRKKPMDYKLPPLSLLCDPPPVENHLTEEEVREKSEILEKTLADFGIEAKVVQVTEGPVVTLFALQPAPGVKINRIVSLENDLAMVLRA